MSSGLEVAYSPILVMQHSTYQQGGIMGEQVPGAKLTTAALSILFP